MKKNWLARILKVSLVFLIACGISIFISEIIIVKNAKQKMFSETKNIPKNKVGVLLGISKKLDNGRIDPYYVHRVSAAVKLYKSGKITYIVVSGDGSSKEDDQPTDFKNDLIKGGVPADKIYLDGAGFRTLDSAVRIKEIFGQNSVTMISQEFHNERAIYLAEHFGINAVGFNAKDVSGFLLLKRHIREPLARVKVFIDILFKVGPKMLGEKIEIK